MCFSATASFTSGAILIVAGIFTLRHVRVKSSIPFASIPLLFGIQQTIEGMVWISFGSPIFHSVVTYIFALFAYVLWPIFVPITIWLIEKNPVRKKILFGISIVGTLVGIYLFACSIAGPVTCSIVQKSIAYQINVPYPFLSFLLYFFATCVGSMVSSSLKIRIFGTAMLLSFFVAHALYPETLFSVWCFFAALLSLIIYIHMKDLRALVAS
ncbi:MAG: hypothetical protein PHN60_00670 [Candidatus Gracilibacteria bacterium]|nr:hypothetical protein [Candidatus Gracilibacteria bacterium]